MTTLVRLFRPGIRRSFTCRSPAAGRLGVLDGCAADARRPDGKGGFFITLPRGVVDRLNYLREPGMSYSDVILALTKAG